MPRLHISTDQVTTEKILGFLENLSRQGAQIELLDDVVLAREKMMIDKALREINEGRTYDLNSVEVELCGED